MPLRLPPCKGCPDRIEGCHSRCDKYKEYRALLDADRELKSAEQSEERDIKAARRASAMRNAKKYNRKNSQWRTL